MAVTDTLKDSIEANAKHKWLLKKENEMQCIGITIEQQMEEEGKNEKS